MEIDGVARQVVCASLLYYSLDIPMLEDGEFDRMCCLLHDLWEDLSPIRQWQLGSAEEIRSSGNFTKATMAAAYASAQWMEDKGFPRVKGHMFYPDRSWNVHTQYGRWLPVTAFKR